MITNSRRYMFIKILRLYGVFTATANTSGENGDKKQNTLPYTLQVKVVEVCLVGAGDESLAFGGAPRWTIINCPFCRQFCRYRYLIEQNAHSRSRLHPRLPSIIDLFPKRKTPRWDVFLFGAGERARNRHTATGIKTHIFARFLAIFWHFCVVFYPFSNRLWGGNFEPTSAFYAHTYCNLKSL